MGVGVSVGVLVSVGVRVIEGVTVPVGVLNGLNLATTLLLVIQSVFVKV